MQVTAKNFASRNRKNQSEFRKHQLIEATMDCIDKLGLSQTTLARIAERAGISQGNVVFHFHSKEELLDQTLRHLDEEYKTNWQQALSRWPPCRMRIIPGFQVKFFPRRRHFRMGGYGTFFPGSTCHLKSWRNCLPTGAPSR